jgi:signal transduction histidine kinase
MKNWTMDLLKYRPFPELAAALRQRKAMVIERWLETVRTTLPAAHELTLTQVRNELPQTLELMAGALEADDPKPTKDLMDQAGTHGESRFDQNFALSELMIEYGLLRPILIEEMAEHLDRVVTVEEIQALNLAVDIAARRGVTAYVTQQKAELQALVEAQTKYLSFLSHDLRGGLNGVLLMIEVLRRDLEAEPKFRESLNDLEVMKRSILETVSTMDRFLHAERFRKGKVQIKPAEMDLCALAREMVGQFGYQAKDKGLELAIDTPADGARVVSDRELLTMILQNLVGNAIKYSRRGTVRVIVERDGGPEHPWRLAVSDQGPGIDPAKAADLFKPFSRGETFGQAGTGLGLSIARQAADLLGARLWAESQPGEGSKFCLDLPPEPPTRAA